MTSALESYLDANEAVLTVEIDQFLLELEGGTARKVDITALVQSATALTVTQIAGIVNAMSNDRAGSLDTDREGRIWLRLYQSEVTATEEPYQERLTWPDKGVVYPNWYWGTIDITT